MREENSKPGIPFAVQIVIAMLSLGPLIYFGLFLSARYWRKTTNDGPGEVYDRTFAPLSAVAAEKPDYWQDVEANGGQLDVFVEQVNEGNGYVYFQYKTKEYRAFSGASLRSEHTETNQKLKFTATIVTDDAFVPRFVVSADLTKESERAGTGQPATRPESKFVSSDKPQPEAEGGSR